MSIARDPESHQPARIELRQGHIIPHTLALCDGKVVAGPPSTVDIQEAASLMSTTDPWRSFLYTETECRERLAANTDSVWALKEGWQDGRFIGFFAIQRHGLGSAPMISLICIAPSTRGRGVGSAAIRAVEEYTFRVERNLYLCVSDFNTAAIRLYERLGFSRIGTIPNYNFTGSSEFIMRKTSGAKRDHLRNAEIG